MHHMKQLTVIVLCAALSSCGLLNIGSCSSAKVMAYGTRIERELEVYEGILDIAGTTSRIALAGPRQELQKQRFVVKDIETPPCLVEYHERVLKMMEQQERGYEFFASDSSDASDFVSSFIIQLADEDLADLKDALPELLAGRVPVLPAEEEATPEAAN